MDIVGRLRSRPNDSHMETERLLDESADYIEELEGRLSALEDAIEVLGFTGAIERYEHEKIKELKPLLRNAFSRGRSNETR